MTWPHAIADAWPMFRTLGPGLLVAVLLAELAGRRLGPAGFVAVLAAGAAATAWATMLR